MSLPLLPTDMPPQTIHLDCKLNPAALTVDMLKQIAYLEPFGTDNPSPYLDFTAWS
ncbi:MAG: hypothetical protein ACLR13_00565 [Acutalibacteraceae bacterium]